MKIERKALLATLQGMSVGLSPKPILEQSNAFVFLGEDLYTFNGEILAKAKNPFDFDAIVLADDFIKLLGKIPDDEIDVTTNETEIRIKGRRREAGITCTTEVFLPFETVPVPDEMSKLEEKTLWLLAQAARTCGIDETKPLTTCVHITPDRIEACDNLRLLRSDGDTGFPEEVLIPASSLLLISKLTLTHVSVTGDWAHFKTAEKIQISVRCHHMTYHQGLDPILEVEGEDLKFPVNLQEIVERAIIMDVGGADSEVHIEMINGKLTITSRKKTGWYKETKKVKFEGELSFTINPKFLIELLEKTRKVRVGNDRLKIEIEGTEFVTCLSAEREE